MGLPVIGIREASVLTKITGWLMAEDEPRAACLLTESEFWYENARALTFDSITGISSAVLVSDGEGIRSLRDFDELEYAAEACNLGIGAKYSRRAAKALAPSRHRYQRQRNHHLPSFLTAGCSIAMNILSCAHFNVSPSGQPALLTQTTASRFPLASATPSDQANPPIRASDFVHIRSQRTAALGKNPLPSPSFRKWGKVFSVTLPYQPLPPLFAANTAFIFSSPVDKSSAPPRPPPCNRSCKLSKRLSHAPSNRQTRRPFRA
jgi:hypothetical protein